MAGYVCTVAGGKGGVGKTTTVINVAVALQDAGHDVVVVDADLGMANLGAMLGVDHDPSLHQVLAGKASISDAITEGPGGITVVPGERRLEAFADADPANLRKVIEALATAYEVVIVDTGAGLSHETTVPLGLADSVLLVTTADDVAVGDTVKTAQLAERVDGTVAGAVLTRADDETNVSAVADELDMEMLAVVPEDVEATRTEPLLVHAEESYVADAYRRLADRVEEIYEADTDGGATADNEFETGDDEDGDGGDGADDAAEAAAEDEADGEEDESGGGVFGLFS